MMKGFKDEAVGEVGGKGKGKGEAEQGGRTMTKANDADKLAEGGISTSLGGKGG